MNYSRYFANSSRIFVSVAFDSMYMVKLIFCFYFAFFKFILLLVAIGFTDIQGDAVLW